MADLNIDIIIPFVGFLAFTCVIAYLAVRRMSKRIAAGGSYTSEYYVSGRSMSGFVLAFTFMATYTTAGSFIGYPAYAYREGFIIWIELLSMATVAFLVFTLVGKRVGVIGRRIGAVTIPDIFKARYESKILIFGSVVAIVVLYTGYMIAQLTGGARLLEVLAGLPFEVSVFIFVAIIVGYTALGGFTAVTWTDTIQGVLMATGVWFVVIGIFVTQGGVQEATQSLYEWNSQSMFGPGVEGSRTLPAMVSYWVLWVMLGLSMPTTTSRFLAYKDTIALHKALIWATVAATSWYLSLPIVGVYSRAVLGHDIAIADQVVALTYTSVLPGWLAGIVIAAPFAAVMSTVSSFLLVIVSSVVKDAYINYYNPKASQRQVRVATIGTTLLIGLVALILTLNPPKMLLDRIVWASSGLNAAFCVPFLGALFWKRATKQGGMAAFFGGLISFAIIDLTIKNPLGVFSFIWAVAISAILLVVVSKKTEPSSVEVLETFYGKEKL